MKPWLIPGALGLLDRVFGRLDDVVGAFSVARARDAAWVHAKALWSMRSDAQLSHSYLATLDHTPASMRDQMGRAISSNPAP